MGFLGKIFFAVLLDIFLEIYVFIEIAERLGYLQTAGFLFFFSVAGYIITKRIKYISFQNAVADISKGKIINKNLIKSIAFFIAGILFFIPGFVTDFIAFLFLIPFLNYYLVYLIFKYLKNKFKTGAGYTYYYSGGYGEPEERPAETVKTNKGQIENSKNFKIEL